jgi:hypothetical protein
MSSKLFGMVSALAASTGMAFQSILSSDSSARVSGRSATALRVAVDPTTITKKEYQDICGVEFNDETLEQRLRRTSFLYPKHVEVIEDIAPIASAMVDEIVSGSLPRPVTDVIDRHQPWLQRCSDHLSFSSISSFTYARSAYYYENTSCWKQAKSPGNHKTTCLTLPNPVGRMN